MFSLEGTFDIHVHAFPDVIPRVDDDLTIARKCREAGMCGIAVKAMQESTTSRAYYVNQLVDNFRMVGGICLNYPVGGLNPSAVDTCLRTGGLIVWMPTLQAKFHAGLKGKLGQGSAGLYYYNPAGCTGITILDEAGELLPQMKEIVALVKEYNALIGTSHLSPEEILKLVRHCEQEEVKISVTHLGWTPEYNMELAKEAIAHKAVVELTAVTFGGYTHKMHISDCVNFIQTLGVDNLVLATDAGAIRFAQPCEYLRTFAENLIVNGISETDVRTMMTQQPLRLIAE